MEPEVKHSSVVDSISCALVVDFLKETGHHQTALDLIDLKGQELPDLCGLSLQNVVSLSKDKLEDEEKATECPVGDLEQVSLPLEIGIVIKPFVLFRLWMRFRPAWFTIT